MTTKAPHKPEADRPTAIIPNPWAEQVSPAIQAYLREQSSLRAMEMKQEICTRVSALSLSSSEGMAVLREIFFVAACRIFVTETPEDATEPPTKMWDRNVLAVANLAV